MMAPCLRQGDYMIHLPWAGPNFCMPPFVSQTRGIWLHVLITHTSSKVLKQVQAHSGSRVMQFVMYKVKQDELTILLLLSPTIWSWLHVHDGEPSSDPAEFCQLFKTARMKRERIHPSPDIGFLKSHLELFSVELITWPSRFILRWSQTSKWHKSLQWENRIPAAPQWTVGNCLWPYVGFARCWSHLQATGLWKGFSSPTRSSFRTWIRIHLVG